MTKVKCLKSTYANKLDREGLKRLPYLKTLTITQYSEFAHAFVRSEP